MIQIQNANLIGSGQDRVVYQDPTNPDRCIKIPRIDNDKKQEAKSFHDYMLWLSRGLNSNYFDHNFVDVLYANFLSKRNNPHAFDHLPKCFGFVETDLGMAVSWELIRNYDGSPCISLADCEKNPGLLGINERALLQDALDDFFTWQLKNRILLREMAFSNTLIRTNEDGQIKLYHIDAIGCVDFIPLALYADWFSYLRILIKINRFKKRLPWIK